MNGLGKRVNGRSLLVCVVAGCDGVQRYSRGWCGKHYAHWRRHGDPEFNTGWGEGSITNTGYRRRFVDGKEQHVHRSVMEEALGRPLIPGENVHHINGNRLDNRLENLELWSTSQPAGQRVEDKVRWAQEILALYSHQSGAINPPGLASTTQSTPESIGR